MVDVGYAYRPNKKWKIEFDVEWAQWSLLESIPLNFRFLPDQELPKDWEDTFSYRLGTEFRPCSGWKLWAGYLFLPTPIPDRTFDPSIPDADAHIFCFGIGRERKNLSLALSQEFSFPEDRTINEGGLFDGTYETFNSITTVNIQYNF